MLSVYSIDIFEIMKSFNRLVIYRSVNLFGQYKHLLNEQNSSLLKLNNTSMNTFCSNRYRIKVKIWSFCLSSLMMLIPSWSAVLKKDITDLEKISLAVKSMVWVCILILMLFQCIKKKKKKSDPPHFKEFILKIWKLKTVTLPNYMHKIIHSSAKVWNFISETKEKLFMIESINKRLTLNVYLFCVSQVLNDAVQNTVTAGGIADFSLALEYAFDAFEAVSSMRKRHCLTLSL